MRLYGEILTDLLGRIPNNGIVVGVVSDGEVAESFLLDPRCVRSTAVDALRWDHEPIDMLVVDRRADGVEVREAITQWMMHVATGGFCVLLGWTPGEKDAPFPPAGWRGVDSRVWVPVRCEGTAMSWMCVGAMTDV